MSKIARIFAIVLGLASLAAPAMAQTVCGPTPALPDTERRTEYAGIVSQTGPFNVGFQLYGDGTDYGNWVSVWVNGVALTPVTDFIVTSPTGTLATICRPITDAQVTFTAAQTGTIEIEGSQRPRRTSQASENAGITARTFNQVISTLTAELRERWDRQGRLVRSPPGETLAVLPPAAKRANGYIQFDATGLIPQISPNNPGTCGIFGTSNSGCVPSSGGGTINFLRADGSWVAGGVGAGVANQLAYYATTGSAVTGLSQLVWNPLAGASGNGQFVMTAPSGLLMNAADVTTIVNSVTFGGTITAGKVVDLTLNYNDRTGAPKSVHIQYTEVGGDTIATVTAGMKAALIAAGQIAPLSTDLAPFRFVDTATVGTSGGNTLSFNFYWLSGAGAGNGTPTLTFTNNSTAGSTTTLTINGSLTGIGATASNPNLTLDVVSTIGHIREYSTIRPGRIADNVWFDNWIGNDSAGNPATFATMNVYKINVTPGSILGHLSFAGGQSTTVSTFHMSKGLWQDILGGGVPVPVYFGATDPFTTGVADLGIHTFVNGGYGVFGHALVGLWPANTSYALFGTSVLDQSAATNYAVVQGAAGDTLFGTVTTMEFRRQNVSWATMNADGTFNFKSTADASSPSVAALMSAGGLGVAKKAFFGDIVTIAKNNLGAVSTDGGVLSNTQSAGAGAQQFSPRLRLTGAGWKTNATAGSQQVDWIVETQPVQGTTAPLPALVFSYQVNGGGYTIGASLNSGVLNMSTGFQIGSAAPAGHYLRGQGSNYVDAVIAVGDLPAPYTASSYTQNGVLFGGAGGTSISATAQGPANSVLVANAGAPSFTQAPIFQTSMQVGTVTPATGAFGNVTCHNTTCFFVADDGTRTFFFGTDNSNLTMGSLTAHPFQIRTGNQQVALYGTSGGYAIGIGFTPTLANGNLAIPKNGSCATAPGAGGLSICAIAGTNAGTCKLVALAGTSTTPVTIVDNVGGSC